MHIITIDDKCPIRPEHIDGSKNFMGTIWQNMETEISANWLVRFAQGRKSWRPFTVEELEEFYHRKWPNERFHFNKLRGYGNDYIVDTTCGKLAFTTEFVAACYAVSPV